MAQLAFVLVFLVTFSLAESAGIVTAKGFYCKDPDTGKLYPLNATWTATSFCGSYTCKLRKRNVTVTLNENQGSEAIGQIDKTENEPEDTTVNPTTTTTTTAAPEMKSGPSILTEKRTKPLIDALLHKNIARKLEEKESSKERNAESSDRYLTDGEIRALYQLLQAAKKSDLEAIIEVYNLAQDIYKEMETTDDNDVEEAIKDMKSKKYKLEKEGLKEKIKSLEKNMNKQHVSYWYEPKTKNIETDELTIPVVPKVKTVPKDMFFEGSNSVPEVAFVRKTPPPQGYKQTIDNKEFPILPYYFPITNFQRVASYVNPQPYETRYEKPPSPPCKHHHSPPNMYPYIPTMYNAQKPIQEIHKDNYGPSPVYNQRKPLPYPLAYIHYNLTSPYFGGNPWQYINLQNNNQPQIGLEPPSYLDATYVAHIPNAVLVNPDLTDDIQDVEQKPVNKNLIGAVATKNKVKEEKKFPEWQSNPLSLKVLREVKANMETKPKLLPFPFRKKVKLERVGKLIKMEDIPRSKRDHLLRRLKRHTILPDINLPNRTKEQKTTTEIDNKISMPINGTEDIVSTSKIHGEDDQKKIRSKRQKTVAEEYEVFVEKTTCVTDTEPGFFRVGNLTQPFPACCPQRIGVR